MNGQGINLDGGGIDLPAFSTVFCLGRQLFFQFSNFLQQFFDSIDQA